MEPPRRPSTPPSTGTFWPLVQKTGQITYQITSFIARTVQKIILIAYHLIKGLFIARPPGQPAPPPPLPLPAPVAAVPKADAVNPIPAAVASPPARAIVLSPAFEELRKTINQLILQLSDDVVTVNVAPLLEPLQRMEPKVIAGKVIDVLNEELEAQGSAERSTPYATEVVATDPNSIIKMYESGYKEYQSQLTQKVYAQVRLKNLPHDTAIAQAEQERKKLSEKPSSDLQEECRALYLSQTRTSAYMSVGKLGPASKALANPQAVDRELLIQEHLKTFSNQLLDSIPKIKQYFAPALTKALGSLVEPHAFLELVRQHLLPVIRDGLLKALIMAVAKNSWEHIGAAYYNYNVSPTRELRAHYLKQICTEIDASLAQKLTALVKSKYLHKLIEEIVETYRKEGTLLKEALLHNAKSATFTTLALPFTQLHASDTPEDVKQGAYALIQETVLGWIPQYKQLKSDESRSSEQFKQFRQIFNKQCDKLVGLLVADMRLRLKPPAPVTDKAILEVLLAALNQDAFTQDDSLPRKLLSTALNAGAAFSPKVGGAVKVVSTIFQFASRYLPVPPNPLEGLIAPSINRIVEPFLGSADQLAKFCNAHLIDTFYNEDGKTINMQAIEELLPSKNPTEKLTPYQAAIALDNDLRDLAKIAHALCEKALPLGAANALVRNDPDFIFRKLRTIFHAFTDHKMINFARVEALVNALKK